MKEPPRLRFSCQGCLKLISDLAQLSSSRRGGRLPWASSSLSLPLRERGLQYRGIAWAEPANLREVLLKQQFFLNPEPVSLLRFAPAALPSGSVRAGRRR